MKHVLIGAAASLCIVTGASAQSVGDQGSYVELSYTTYTSDILPDEIDITSLHFSTAGAYNLTPSFGFQYGVGFNRYSLGIDVIPLDISLDFVDFDLHGYYNVNQDIKVGVFVSDVIFDQINLQSGGMSESLGLDIYALIYGGEVMASFGAFDVEAYAGVGSLAGDDFDLIGADVDMLIYGIDVAYEISPKLSVNASWNSINFDIESGLAGIDITSYRVGAEYALTNELSVNANVHGGSLLLDGDGIDWFGYGVGVEYDLPVQVFGGSELTAFASVSTNELGVTLAPETEDSMNYTFGVRMSFGGVASGNKLFTGPTLF